MRKLSRMISPKLRRRTNGWPVCAGNGGGPNNSGMVLAVVQTLSDSRRTSFVGSKRPSRFQSLSVPSSTGPYSFSPTRTSHRSAIDRQTYRERATLSSRAQVEGSRNETFKVMQQDPSTFARDDGNNSLFHETAFDRRTLLRLPLIFRDPEPEQLARRTNQRHFRFHQNAAADAETFAAATRGGVLGRRFAAAPGGIAARL